MQWRTIGSSYKGNKDQVSMIKGYREKIVSEVTKIYRNQCYSWDSSIGIEQMKK